jgi:hypothetical protein
VKQWEIPWFRRDELHRVDGVARERIES